MAYLIVSSAIDSMMVINRTTDKTIPTLLCALKNLHHDISDQVFHHIGRYIKGLSYTEVVVW